MLFRSTLLASATLAIISTMVDAHSWADCVDWRPNDINKPSFAENGGKCVGWARQYPVNSGVRFGGLDSSSPNRHYQQDTKDFTPCSDGVRGNEPGADETRQNPISKAYGGRFGAMATVKAGEKMCVRWPAKNHAVANEKENFVFINMPSTPLAKDPATQAQFSAAFVQKLPFKNCNPISGDTDHTPCGGCWTVPADRAPGTYVVQWRWELNNNEFYTSCWDLQVTGNTPDGGKNSTGTPLGGSTSVFAELAED
ncbi:hypothetical protein BGZ82_005876 [Podila clonocystis]|nr:hypothetical protein BGZ82_005876 [Podila clonocystis]